MQTAPCITRALDLIDLSIQWASQMEENRREHPGAIRESALVREAVCHYFLGENENSSDGDALL